MMPFQSHDSSQGFYERKVEVNKLATPGQAAIKLFRQIKIANINNPCLHAFTELRQHLRAVLSPNWNRLVLCYHTATCQPSVLSS